MRRLRKNTIFRVYLFAVCLSFVFAGIGALLGQRRFYVARLERLDSRLSDLALAVESATNSVVSSSVVESPKQVQQEREPDPFWVEGHGFNKRYAYLDICFPDGYRARYYFRPFPSRGELASLHRRIHHDADIHSFVLDDWEEDI